MARHVVVALVLAALALVCLLQTASASIDWFGETERKIQQTIESKNITCSTYEEFCNESSRKSLPNGQAKDSGSNNMTAELCKAIFKVYVCEKDLDKKPTSNEE